MFDVKRMKCEDFLYPPLLDRQEARQQDLSHVAAVQHVVSADAVKIKISDELLYD